MKEYILLFRHENMNRKVSPEQMQHWMKQQMEWVDSIASKNKFVSGTGLLFDDAKVVNHQKFVTNGPFGDIKETLGGYIVVKAESADEAAEFAKGAPILQGEGNTVEVRQIVTH
ncbi:YciI family protein [Parapedobacter sp. GCM10030251]|uniref:YciI family protein n=1 Tax=Parapedobacter sp. GCM10030251 TaxID=3273419 RepID=UPI0036155CCF